MGSPGALSGKVALVTGSGRGIGRAIARQLVEAGARVALVARSVDQLEATAEAIRDAGGLGVVVPTDLADQAAVVSAAERVNEQLGPVDILVSNAGRVQPVGSTLGISLTDWARVFAVNVTAPLQLAQLLAPGMRDRGWGRIVNVSSGITAHPEQAPGLNAYAASKAALDAHSRNLASELSGTGVTVNLFWPGSVDTAMQEAVRTEPTDDVGAVVQEWFRTNHGRGMLITAEESARALLSRLVDSDATGETWGFPEDQ